MAIRRIGAREANQQFSALLKSVEENGDTVIITRRGAPIVRIERAAEQRDPEKVAQELDAFFEKYASPMSVGSFDRDALHERDMKIFRQPVRRRDVGRR